jgi:hypothetical protein
MAVSAAPAFSERWKIQLFYDKDQSSLDIHDLECPSAKTCIAAGIIEESHERRKGTVIVTSDGGAHWNYVDLKDLPTTLFFLNETHGWMATEKAVWESQDSGQSWKKLKGLHGIERLWFVDEKHGWAVGGPKAIYETKDGGVEWTKNAAADLPPTKPEETSYDWVYFSSPQRGFIVGSSSPDRKGNQPYWVHVDKLVRGTKTSDTTIFLETSDGGANWHYSALTSEGLMTRFQASGPNEGLALFEFPSSRKKPSELYRLNLETHALTPVFAEDQRVARDFALLPGGQVFLASLEVTGLSSQVPIPAKLKMTYSPKRPDWVDEPVDYRAVAIRPILAVPDLEHAWVATDTGMILQRVPSGEPNSKPAAH